ncbi:Na+/H+ antiporter, NhaP family [hydrothermal vent metagenome]|uniref:Na+/H+ antiporter, NhaP family n=1 Tax=hydrothermal vent metagenome TaxID=652676 RepID=A0A3B1B9B4_9ZZZZ
MDFLNTTAVLISLAALFSYLNYRYLKIPTTIGIMLIALSISLGLLAADFLGLTHLGEQVEKLLHSIDFQEALMQGMLSFLLFAGALHVSLNDLLKQKWLILFLATVGILISTFLVGGMSWVVLNGLGLNVSFIYCLVFGALISPTDPVAVMGILKETGVSQSLKTKIAGESLLNDGVGVVIFLVLLGIATGRSDADVQSISLLLLQEAGGGLLFGLLSGYLVFSMLRQVDNYQVEVLLTLALVMGGYALANALHISGPLAMVVAGLIIGNHGRSLAMSEKTRAHLDMFWELVDGVLNAVLFVLIGMEILVLHFRGEYLLAALVIIPIVLVARYVSVGIPVTLLRPFRTFSPHVLEILTWSGLRGGISVALALSLPLGVERDVILAITYAVVVFSILIQGLTIGALMNGDKGGRRRG